MKKKIRDDKVDGIEMLDANKLLSVYLYLNEFLKINFENSFI